MKKLTLIRHAKSDWHSAAATDFDRPLNERGNKAAPLIGQRLAEHGASPDLLISSPAKRARQTAKQIAKQIDYPESGIDYKDDIYDANLQTLIRLIQRVADHHNEIIMVGHNPGFSELGEWLTAEAPDWLPTCGLLELDLLVDSWTEIEADCGSLLRYDYPKKNV